MKPVADQTRRRCEVSHIRMRDQWSNAAAATTMNRESPEPDWSAPDAELDPTGALSRPLRADTRGDGLADARDLAGPGGTRSRDDRDGHRTDRDQRGPDERPLAAGTAPNALHATQCGPSTRSLPEWRRQVKTLPYTSTTTGSTIGRRRIRS